MIRRWLPQIAFGLLALATIGAFFLVQVLKTANPLIWGSPTPVPAAINPTSSGRAASCVSRSHQLLNYTRAKLTLAVSHADSVGVYIVSAKDAGGPPVATISSGTPMVAAPGPANQAATQSDSRVFTWDGRLDGGRLASPGTYYFRIVLEHEDRSINLSDSPVQVITQPPHPRILSVRLVDATGTGTGTGTGSPAGSSGHGHGDAGKGSSEASGPALLSPPRGRVRITFTPNFYRRVWIDIYRTDVSGGPQLVTRLSVGDLTRNWTVWNGEIGRQPAPAGTYLIGITAQDAACNQASWPAAHPAPGSTPHAGVTIRYLTVTPPLMPTVSGARAAVAVDSPTGGFTWRLRRAGSARVLAHGAGPSGSSTIRVRMPRRRASLYTLVVRAGTQSAVVPLVASRAGRAATRARVLVVLPMLTWMGNTPVDDTGDGLPDTLRAGDAVSLQRPLVDGPPLSLGADAALLSYLDSHHLGYQLTTDVALAEGHGPSLVGRWGVVFADGEHFLPASLRAPLSGFVGSGGRVLALGTGTFQGVSRISGFPTATRASAPARTRTDLFGAQRGPITPTGGQLISELSDAVGLFNGPIAFGGFSQYQPIQPPAGAGVSAAGIANATPAIVAFHRGSGSGIVIEVGLPDFGGSLAHNLDSQALLNSAWHLLNRGP